MSLNFAIVALSIVQLVWLVIAWVKSGFLSALSLFLFATLSSLITFLLLVKDGTLVL